MRKIFYFIGLVFFQFSCEKKTTQENLFSLLPVEQSGVKFENRLKSSDELNIIEYLYFYNGGGVAAADFNNDGLVDLYFTGNQVSNKLYFNRGNLKFEDKTDSAGVSGDGGWSTGVTAADINGDGLLDIYVSQVADYKGLTGRNRLYINQGDETFIDLASQYGVDFEGFSTHSTFFDYDRDGDLDLYILNHSIKSPEVFAQSTNRNIPFPGGDKLYKNLAAEGQRGFVDVTEEAGIYSSILGFGLGVGVEDLNNDGWLDLYVSNDFTENDYLYINQQNGTFLEVLNDLIPNTSRYSMGNDIADLNGDGLPEIFTTDMLPEDPEIWMKSVGEDKQEVFDIKKKFGYQDQYVRNNLQLNQGNIGFSEIALFSGVYATDWSWSPMIADFDQDGLADIYITNGIRKRPNDLDFIQYSQEASGNTTLEELRKRQIDMLPIMKLANYAFRNTGKLKFEEVAEDWGLGQQSYSNGSAYADLDNDGDLDLVINNIDQPAFIYENHSEKSQKSFLQINLNDEYLNHFGLGAKVTLYANDQIWSQRLSAGRGFQSSGSTTLSFGLGELDVLDSITVLWADGMFESFSPPTLNEKITLKKDTGKVLNLEVVSSKKEVPTIPNWTHQEDGFKQERDLEYLLPRSFSNLGPAFASADVNGDGLYDFYVGGAKDQPGQLFIQTSEGNFDIAKNPLFQQLAKAEDVTAAFADFNGDGAVDLYVGSGGNEYKSGNLFYFDRVYFGDGKGGFQFIPNALPPIGENTSSLAIHDLDEDGDLDVFVGVSVLHGDYGASTKSYLLINQGDGTFKEQTKQWFGEIDLGMVNDAHWVDLNLDGNEELVLTGDWQKIRTFEINSGKFIEKNMPGLEFSSGWINDLLIDDFNGDGLMDIATANLGLNSKLKASEEKPLWLYYSDFDQNGQSDALIFHYMDERLVPFASRDDLIKQIPGIKRMHSSYSEYAQIKSPEELFGKEKIALAKKLPAHEFRSGIYFQNQNGAYDFSPFPTAVQFSPILSLSWNEENNLLFLGGNLSGMRVDLGDMLAQSFHTLKWTGSDWKEIKNDFEVPLHAEIREVRTLKIQGKQVSLAVSHDGPIYQIPIN